MSAVPKIDDLTAAIESWGKAVGILPNPEPYKQFSKTVEEVDELLAGIDNKDIAEISDAIGDIYVTLVMQTAAWNLNMAECIEGAYETILKRVGKGKMVDGVFVKEGDVK